ncbi:glutamate receptor ionotropic, NMDA 2D-like [Notolabrus celidotus]|uniref:glutamate receptor ionotropic, NMDA 2D-like n=1 Tax=Notolabrus celidotus TaxID=1203425 RepID=UPI00148F4A70|nr:glutamate receptor ionotropic, NMDA 2D-like [Notolabrus celidotus]
MLEFVSAQTGVPVVAVGGGASLGREPQESGSIYLQFTCSTSLQLEVIFEVLEEYDWTSFSVVTTRHHGYEDFLAMVEGMTDGSFIGWEKKSVVTLNVTDDPGGARTKRLLKDNEAQVREGDSAHPVRTLILHNHPLTIHYPSIIMVVKMKTLKALYFTNISIGGRDYSFNSDGYLSNPLLDVISYTNGRGWEEVGAQLSAGGRTVTCVCVTIPGLDTAPS